MSLKNFLCTKQICSRYLEGVFYLPLYVEKRMEVISPTTQQKNSNSSLKINKNGQEDKSNATNSSCDSTLCDMI